MTAQPDAQNLSRVEMVRALLHPRNVVILGATDKQGTWTQRVWRNLHRYDYPYPVYPLNPGRDTVWDTTCYRSFQDLPEPPDHVVVLIPARHVPAALRDARRAGARSATVFSAGFDEVDAVELAADLKRAIDETGLAVSGPNCLGNISGSAAMMTSTDDRFVRVGKGPVSIIGQSGGIATAIKRALEERCLLVDTVITSGNETGLTTADYISYFAEDPGTRVIISYLEAVRGDPAKFLAACRKAYAAGKSVVVLKLGTSEAGRAAAVAHTGALAGSAAAFDAIAGAAGAIRVATTDEVVEVTEYLAHVPLPKGNRLAAVTLSGGMRGLLLDAASANGITFPPLSKQTEERLEAVTSVGTSIGNPFDAGFAALTNASVLKVTIEAYLDDPEIDLILVQEEIPRAPGAERKEASMETISSQARSASKPVVYASMISHGLTDYGRDFREKVKDVAFLQECDKAIRAIAHIFRHVATTRLSLPERGEPSQSETQAIARLSELSPGPLSEIVSKEIIAAYGVRTTNEHLATSLEDALSAANAIGYPVVAKAVSARLPHKSEAGAVMVGIKDQEALRAACAAIHDNVGAFDKSIDLDGILISEMVGGGAELVIGAHHDPELGPVVVFGSGGTGVELYGDVALGAVPLDRTEAERMIAGTKAARLISGYRGGPPLDKAAVIDALIAVSNLMVDAGGRIQSIDLNPFVLTANGGIALDALVVLSER